MKILCLCDEGNNRSVTLAHQLKYLGHDVLACGTKTNDFSTVEMLYDWADKVIITDYQQLPAMFGKPDKVALWHIGPDVYPRPFNKELLKKVRALIDEHRHELNTES